MTEVFPELSTSRLRLRAVTEADEPSYRALLRLPEVTRFSNIAEAPNQETTSGIMRNMAGLFPSGNGCAWIIEDTASHDFVGAIRFNYFIKPWRCGGIGYEAHPGFWGRGLMSQAVRAVAACGHARFGLNRIEAWTVPGNGASDRVLEKAGFRFEGIQRQKAWLKGAFHDWRFFARLADDPL